MPPVVRRLVLVLTAVVVLAPATTAAPSPKGSVLPSAAAGAALRRLGLQLYAGNCARCHGSAGSGIHDEGPQLTGVGARAADFYLRTGYMPLAHTGEQPHRSRVLFAPREIAALVAYVASLHHGPPVPRPQPQRGSVAAGMTLFSQHCAGCHQIAAEGGYLPGAVAPPLTTATAVQVAEAVRIGPYVMPSFSRHAISDRQLDSIVAYVEQARRPADPGGWSIGRIGPIPEGLIAWFVAGAALVALCVAAGGRLHR